MTGGRGWRDVIADIACALPGADLVILPEMFTTGFSMESAALAEPEDGPSSTWLREQAQRRLLLHPSFQNTVLKKLL